MKNYFSQDALKGYLFFRSDKRTYDRSELRPYFRIQKRPS